jgi:hypothetical protein
MEKIGSKMEKIGSGMGKTQIRKKHSGPAALKATVVAALYCV